MIHSQLTVEPAILVCPRDAVPCANCGYPTTREDPAICADCTDAQAFQRRLESRCDCVHLGGIQIVCPAHARPLILGAHLVLDAQQTALWHASLRDFLSDRRTPSNPHERRPYGGYYEALMLGEHVPAPQSNLIVVTLDEWQKSGPDPILPSAHRTYLYSPKLPTFAVGHDQFRPSVAHRIVEHYFDGNPSAVLHKRRYWWAARNATGRVRTWYGCPTHEQTHDWCEAGSHIIVMPGLPHYLPPASLYDQQKPWADFKWKLYFDSCKTRVSIDIKSWLGKLRGWINQAHTDRDLNYNHRERFQYRDWMFWSGTGLSHDFGAHHTPLVTYRHAFWIGQGLTDAVGPEMSEYSPDYRAQELLRIYESVRVSLNTITRPLGTSCTNGNAAVGTTFDIVHEQETGPSAIRPLARAEVQQEIEQAHLKIEALRQNYESSPLARLTAAEYERILREAGMGQNPPVGENDFGARPMLKMTRLSEAERTTPEGQDRLIAGFSAHNDDEGVSLAEQRLNNGGDYFGNSNQTKEGAERGWDERRQLPTDDGWVPETEKFISAVRADIFDSEQVPIRTAENEQWAKSHPEFSEYVFQWDVMTRGLQKKKEGVKSRTVARRFERGKKYRAEILELAKLGGSKWSPEFITAYNAWLEESPLPGGWYVVLALKENQPRLYRLDCPIECRYWSRDIDNYVPYEVEEAFDELHRTKRAEAVQRAAIGGKRVARDRVDNTFKRTHIYLLPPDNRKP